MTNEQLRQWYKDNNFKRVGNTNNYAHVSEMLNCRIIFSKHPYLQTGKFNVCINGNFVMSGKNSYRQFSTIWQAALYVYEVTK